MKLDRFKLDLPFYEGLLAGHHVKEQGYRLRRQSGTDDWLLVATVSGAGRFASEFGEISARPGGVFLIAPGTPHDYGTELGSESWEIFWIHFKPKAEWIELLNWREVANGIGLLQIADEPTWNCLVEGFRDVHRKSLEPILKRMHYSLNALELLLLDCEALTSQVGKPIDPRIAAALDHIHRNLHEPVQLGEMSKRAHLSLSRFGHLFQAEMGLPPLQYIRVQRMNRAGSLLARTGLRISEIALEVGMEPFYFSARFREHTGMSPREYRVHCIPLPNLKVKKT